MVDILKAIINALHNISVPLLDISKTLSIDNQPKPQPMSYSYRGIINVLHNISVPLLDISENLSIDNQSKSQPKNHREREVRIDDIIFTQNQFDTLFGESERNGISTLSRRWPNNKLPYEIDSSTIAKGSAEETMIKRVVARFNSDMNGCINIV